MPEHEKPETIRDLDRSSEPELSTAVHEGVGITEEMLEAARPKPLHVRVAEALGWEWGTFAGISILMPPGRFEQVAFPGSSWERGCTGRATPPEQAFFDSARGYPLFPPIPRYDTDWAATGPLVERLGIGVSPSAAGWSAWPLGSGLNSGYGVDAASPLLAICNLILAVGRLPR